MQSWWYSSIRQMFSVLMKLKCNLHTVASVSLWWQFLGKQITERQSYSGCQCQRFQPIMVGKARKSLMVVGACGKIIHITGDQEARWGRNRKLVTTFRGPSLVPYFHQPVPPPTLTPPCPWHLLKVPHLLTNSTNNSGTRVQSMSL